MADDAVIFLRQLSGCVFSDMIRAAHSGYKSRATAFRAYIGCKCPVTFRFGVNSGQQPEKLHAE
jgi:hypothetical protein